MTKLTSDITEHRYRRHRFGQTFIRRANCWTSQPSWKRCPTAVKELHRPKGRGPDLPRALFARWNKTAWRMFWSEPTSIPSSGRRKTD